jgi:hypothetical protein
MMPGMAEYPKTRLLAVIAGRKQVDVVDQLSMTFSSAKTVYRTLHDCIIPVIAVCRPAQISCKFSSHLQKPRSQKIYIYIRNGNNVHVNLYSNAEAATYMMDSEVHGMNIHSNM